MRLLIDDADCDLKEMAYDLPWSRDSLCFNFKTPERRISPNDIASIKRPSCVESLVIACDLPDYSFISKMINLTQLYIYSGNNIYDLAFLESLVKLEQICILGSHISTLDALKNLIKKKASLIHSAPKEEKLKAQFIYTLDGICIFSDVYDSDGTELLKKSVCRGEVKVNNHFISAGQRIQ